MGYESTQDTEEDISQLTRDVHRALASLEEELIAVDRYRQRAEACRDGSLRAILLHHMREEIEHSAMLIEWLRRADDGFDSQLRAYVPSDAPIVALEESTNGGDGTVTPAGRTIGALKE